MKNSQIESLVKKAQNGDKEALESLYKHFFNQIYYYIYSRVNNLHDAQEITSNVFLSMVEGIKKFKGQSTFKNYIFGIAKNKIRDYIRNKYKTADFVLESYFEDATFDQIVEEKVDRSHKFKLRDALAEISKMLNPRYSKVLNLRFNEMNSVEETAKIMGISSNNVKVIQHRAIKQANQIWENLNDTDKEKILPKQ
jgi:RNA polymerase sigma-70 factor (ECF subfamily)